MGVGKEISQFSQVLQFEGAIDSLVWKNPIEDFNTTSVLVVDETHEALLVMLRLKHTMKLSTMSWLFD